MPCNDRQYPPHWGAIRQAVLQRAGHRCECTGQCGRFHASAPEDPLPRDPTRSGRCTQRDRMPSAYSARGAPVVLTTAHLCPCQPLCGDLEHLAGLCQACHLALDAALHTRHAARTRLAAREAQGQLRLWES